MYVSIDEGARWQPLKMSLPPADRAPARGVVAAPAARASGQLPLVPITDLIVKDRDLVVATQGRGFWILDDLSPLRQLPQRPAPDVRLLAPRSRTASAVRRARRERRASILPLVRCSTTSSPVRPPPARR